MSMPPEQAWMFLGVAGSLLASVLCRLSARPATRWFVAVGGAGGLVSVCVVVILSAMGRSGIAPAGEVFAFDPIAAPIAPLVSASLLLVLLATPRSKLRRISTERLYLLHACTLAALFAGNGWMLAVAIACSFAVGALERRRASTGGRLFALHALAGGASLLAGQALLSFGQTGSALHAIGGALFAVGLMIRAGLFPFHVWVRDWFDRATLTFTTQFIPPVVSAAGVLHLLHVGTPGWVLGLVGASAAWTVLYAGALATVRTDARLMLASLTQIAGAVVLLAASIGEPLALTAAQVGWIGAIVSPALLIVVVRAVEARVGRIGLDAHHGLFDHIPLLATVFLVAGLSLIGFPATVGFVGTEILIEAAVRRSPLLAGAVVLGLGLAGVALMNMYLRIFTGARHTSTVDIRARTGERGAVLGFVAAVLAVGLFPSVLLPTFHGVAREEAVDPARGAAPADAIASAITVPSPIEDRSVRGAHDE